MTRTVMTLNTPEMEKGYKVTYNDENGLKKPYTVLEIWWDHERHGKRRKTINKATTILEAIRMIYAEVCDV